MLPVVVKPESHFRSTGIMREGLAQYMRTFEGMHEPRQSHPDGASTASADEPLYELHAELCKVFTEPKRLRIMALLGEGERTVNELAVNLGVRPSVVSQHLALMRHSGLVQFRREGHASFYSLAYPDILDACRIVHGILVKRLAAEGQLAAQRPA